MSRVSAERSTSATVPDVALTCTHASITGAQPLPVWYASHRPSRSRYGVCAMPQPESPDESQQGPNIVMPPEEFAGKWANAAAVARTPHEFTLDFLRIGPQGQQGIVVSRVSFSPLLASQLLELLGEQWHADRKSTRLNSSHL